MKIAENMLSRIAATIAAIAGRTPDSAAFVPLVGSGGIVQPEDSVGGIALLVDSGEIA